MISCVPKPHRRQQVSLDRTRQLSLPCFLCAIRRHASRIRSDRCERGLDMQIKPIKSQRDYRKALKQIDELMNAQPNTIDGDRLDVLTTLVEAWEAKHYPIEAPDPVEAIRFAMEQRGVTRRDLEPLIGSRACVAEVLNHKRNLTLPMIRRLHA